MARSAATAKTCTRCGEDRPLDAFSPHPRGREGRQAWCKVCLADYRAERRLTDSDLSARDRAQTRAYYAAMCRVREAHRDEFDRYYADELTRRGVA